MLPYNKRVHDLKNVLNGMKFFADMAYGNYDFTTELGIKAKEEFDRDVERAFQANRGDVNSTNPFSICLPKQVDMLVDELTVFSELSLKGILQNSDLLRFKQVCSDLQESVVFKKKKSI